MTPRVAKVGSGLYQIFHAKVSLKTYVCFHSFVSTESMKSDIFFKFFHYMTRSSQNKLWPEQKWNFNENL